ncbi:MAG: hypothetical protein JWR83_2974 [Aeromicrobium sp.]|nr:hypothetical protein [Aeromicrobium sp.]
MRVASKVTLAFTVAGILTGCTSGHAADRPTRTSGPSTGPTATESIVIDPIDTVAVEGSLPRNQLITLTNAEYACGPTDGPWIQAAMVSSVPIRVFAQLYVGDQTYGRSEWINLTPDVVANVGFAPVLAAGIYGSAGRLVAESATVADLGSVQLELALAPDVFCG